MKTKIFIACFFTLILISGCSQVTETASPDVYVAYQVESAFQNDSVKLALDGKVLLESRVTTNYTVSLAWSSELQKLSRSNHTLHFTVVDYMAQKDFQINTSYDTSTVLIHFDRDGKQIKFEQVKGMILRE